MFLFLLSLPLHGEHRINEWMLCIFSDNSINKYLLNEFSKIYDIFAWIEVRVDWCVLFTLVVCFKNRDENKKFIFIQIDTCIHRARVCIAYANVKKKKEKKNRASYKYVHCPVSRMQYLRMHIAYTQTVYIPIKIRMLVIYYYLLSMKTHTTPKYESELKYISEFVRRAHCVRLCIPSMYYRTSY